MGDRVVIAGGGIVGLSSALFLAEAGYRVTVLDRRPPGGDHCALGSAGMIVPSHFTPLAAPGVVAQGLRWMFRRDSPFYLRPRPSPDLARWGWRFIRSCRPEVVRENRVVLRDLSLQSRELYDAWAGRWPIGLAERGLLMLTRSEEGLEEEARLAAEAAELGIEAEVADPSRLGQIDPGARMDVLGGVHYPRDAWLDPAGLIRELERELGRAGADLRWNAPVTGVRCQPGGIAAFETPTGPCEGDHFVLATGSWAPGLAGRLGLRILVQPGKGYSLTLPSPPAMPAVSSILVEAKVAVTPMDGRLRFGGTMEIGGRPGVVDARRLGGLVRSIPSYYPEFTEADFAGIEPWSGLRPCSPDGLPYLGRPPRHRNLVIAAGHGMLGLSLGPVTGQLVARTVAGEPWEHEAALAPDRFARRR